MNSADVVSSFYNAIDTGDIPAGLALIAADCAWTEMEGFPYRGTYHGPDAVLENVFARIGSEWDGFALAVDEVLDAGDRAVGVGTYSGVFKATGKPMKARVVHVFRIRDGQIVAFEQFTDTLEVATATGER
jgi:ketosteroid isomerase-like protein